MKQATEKQDWLTIPDVAKRLRVHTATIRRWIDQGTLPAIVLPHRGKRRIHLIKMSVFQRIVQTQAHGEAND